MKSTQIFKVNCPNCESEVWIHEIISYSLNSEVKFACPCCGDK